MYWISASDRKVDRVSTMTFRITIKRQLATAARSKIIDVWNSCFYAYVNTMLSANELLHWQAALAS